MAELVEDLSGLDRASLLKLLETHYLSIVCDKPFYKSLFQHEEVKPLVSETQLEILKVTLNHPVAQRYSPPVSFKRFFLRILYDEVEQSGFEISEELLLLYTDTLVHNADNTNCYYNYVINENIITIEESSRFVINSTTGLKTWEAAKYLVEWCVENPSHFESGRVLELGSGTGLLGISLLKTACPSVFVFSDKSVEVLRLLARNVQLNICDHNSDLEVTGESCLSSEASFCDTVNYKRKICTSTKIDISYLEWGNLTNEEAKLLSPDIILAADVVYDPSVITDLVSTLHTFLTKSAKFAYFAFVVRNADTHACFLQQLDAVGLTYESLPGPENKIFVYDRTSCFKLYKIFIS